MSLLRSAGRRQPDPIAQPRQPLRPRCGTVPAPLQGSRRSLRQQVRPRKGIEAVEAIVLEPEDSEVFGALGQSTTLAAITQAARGLNEAASECIAVEPVHFDQRRVADGLEDVVLIS